MKKQETRLETLRRYLSVLEEIEYDPQGSYIIQDFDDFGYMQNYIEHLIKKEEE